VTTIPVRLARSRLESVPTTLQIVRRQRDQASLAWLDLKAAHALRGKAPNEPRPSPFLPHNCFRTSLSGQEHRLLYSPDGRLIAQIEGDGVAVYDAETGDAVFRCRGRDGTVVQAVDFSPLATYFVTCSKILPKRDASGAAVPAERTQLWTHHGGAAATAASGGGGGGAPRRTEAAGNLVVWGLESGDVIAVYQADACFSPERCRPPPRRAGPAEPESEAAPPAAQQRCCRLRREAGGSRMCVRGGGRMATCALAIHTHTRAQARK
jgi:hypothetical protein